MIVHTTIKKYFVNQRYWFLIPGSGTAATVTGAKKQDVFSKCFRKI